MLFEVLGIEERTGEYKGINFTGRNLYCRYPDSYKSDRLTGVKTEKIWVNDRVQCPPLTPGDHIEVYYNRYGRVDSVSIA